MRFEKVLLSVGKMTRAAGDMWILRSKQTVQQLRNLSQMLAPISDALDDSLMLSGSEAYQGALVFYSNVKSAAKVHVPKAQTVYDDLSTRFPGAPAKKAAPAKKVAAKKPAAKKVAAKKPAAKKVAAKKVVAKKPAAKKVAAKKPAAKKAAAKKAPAKKAAAAKKPAAKKPAAKKAAKKPAAKKAAKAPAAKAAPAAPAAQTTLNPQAAWPFPTSSKP